MNKAFRLIINVVILFSLVLLFIWGIIARPIIFNSGVYNPELVVDPGVLEDHVRIMSEDFLSRSYDHPENLLKSATYIQSKLLLSSSNVYFQNFEFRGVTYSNVIATYGPQTERRIVVGAHYDVYGDLPGADDNASGVAGLIELGALLAKDEPPIFVELVAYTLEEPPFFGGNNMGSAIHAKSLREEGINVELMISLEMIGYFSDEQDSQNFPLSFLSLIYPDKGNFIAVVDQLWANDAQGVKSAINRHTNLPAYSINAPKAVPGIDFSDHRNYWEYGYPAVMVTDTSFYRNFAYHTEADTYDKLDYQKMANVVYGVFKYIQEESRN